MRTLSLTLSAGCLALLVACATSVERAPFTEEAPATPAETPEQTAVPGKAPQSAPVTTDAGAAPDAPDTCNRTAPSKKCGLVPQCGCTLAETCDVEDGTGNVGCVTAGKAPMGGACIATPGCAIGLTCVFGTCHAFCDNPGSACTAAKTGGCVQVKNQSGAAIPNLSVCRVACDLRDANACGGTTAAGTGVCMVDDTGVTDCAKGGTRTVTQACTPTDDCGPTLVCTVSGTATAGTCKKWCRVGTNDCGGTTACNGFQTPVKVGTVEYGACP
jgi:hypothetical protein